MSKLKDALLNRPVFPLNWNCPSPSVAHFSIFSQRQQQIQKAKVEMREDNGITTDPVLGLSPVRN